MIAARADYASRRNSNASLEHSESIKTIDPEIKPYKMGGLGKISRTRMPSISKASLAPSLNASFL